MYITKRHWCMPSTQRSYINVLNERGCRRPNHAPPSAPSATFVSLNLRVGKKKKQKMFGSLWKRDGLLKPVTRVVVHKLHTSVNVVKCMM